jgi:hypothetical protein
VERPGRSGHFVATQEAFPRQVGSVELKTSLIIRKSDGTWSSLIDLWFAA